MKTIEANIDGLVGPTHNYAGLSFGNVASEKNAQSVSNPKQAALQGLAKMKYMHDLGLTQLVMPPHPRPDIKTMYTLGFNDVIVAPDDLLQPLYSASAMWTANAATISPAADTQDGKTHITPANMASKLHRAIETQVTSMYLKTILPEPHFVHHVPLPSTALFYDEGAANHMRLCKLHSETGTELFVYGGTTSKYPARQSLHASQAVVRLHKLNPSKVIFLLQKAVAIDAGVFHNDVIAMSNEKLFIYHEHAYENISEHAKALSDFTTVVIKEKDLPINDAVKTYFFNSQLVTLPSNKMVVIAPTECEENTTARKCFDKLISDGHIEQVHYMNLRESMKNGGGPACLRLRLPLNETELVKVNSNFILNDLLYDTLCQWIKKYYRDTISSNDLRDPLLAKEALAAISELYTILGIKAEIV